MEMVIIMFLCIIPCSSSLNKGCTNLFEDDNLRTIKSTIMKWWRTHNVTKPTECKQKTTKHYTEYGENEFIKLLPAPEIKSFPCSGSATSQKYHFGGSIREGYLEGKGKLEFIGEEEWSKLSNLDSKRKKIMAMRNVCVIASTLQANKVKEIIGSFKNGSLQGLTKVTYIDKSFYIGYYKHGKAHGYGRIFDSEGSLMDAGGYYSGWEAAYHWRYRHGHILYQKRDIVNDYVSPTLVFAIAKDGSLTDPIAGDYFHHSGTLTNIHNVRLINTSSSKSNCVLDIEYKLSTKENYTYSLSSKIRYPLFGQKDYKVLCNTTKRYETGNIAERLKKWIDSITNLLEYRSIRPGMAFSRAPEILWQLRPELEQLDADKSIKLISNIVFCSKINSMKATIFGSSPVKIKLRIGLFSVDNDSKLNGFNEIEITPERKQHVPRDKSLNWYPTRIAGNFKHGVLNGLALITTNVSTNVWAMVEKGTLHGPCVVDGISYIIDPVRSNLKLSHQSI